MGDSQAIVKSEENIFNRSSFRLKGLAVGKDQCSVSGIESKPEVENKDSCVKHVDNWPVLTSAVFWRQNKYSIEICDVL